MKVHVYLAIGQYFSRGKAEAIVTGVFPTMDEARDYITPYYMDGTFYRVAAYGYDVDVNPMDVLKAMFRNVFKVGARERFILGGEAVSGAAA